MIAEWAVEARWLLVLVRDPRFERYALVALSGAEAGLVRAPVEVLDHQRVAAVSWDAVRCDQRQVVAGGDWRFALGVMTSLDVMRGAESVGMATRMVEMTCGYVGARRQFDRQLSTFQVVQHRCARMLVATTAAALAIREAVVGIDAGSGSFLQMLIAGRAAVRSLEEVAMEASLLHGAVGFMAEHPLARLFRRAGAAKCRAGPFSCFEEAVMAEISAVRYGGAPGALGDVYPWLIDDAKET